MQNPAKRSRSDAEESMKPRKRRIACQSCRIRKVKCDNTRPSCMICQAHDSECVYLEDLPPAGAHYIEADALELSQQNTSSLVMERLDQILAGVNGITSSIYIQGSSPATIPSPASAATQKLAIAQDQLEELNEGSRDYLNIPACKATADEALTWPIFEGKYQQDALIGKIFDPEEPCPSDDNRNGYSQPSNSQSNETYQVQGGLQSLPDERIPVLIDRFLERVHTKNPILDVDALLRHGRQAAESGLGWDAPSCLVLVCCAMGSIAHPFEFNTTGEATFGSETPHGTSSSIFSRELALAESCYVLACRRLGLLKPTVLGAQCHFYTGVYLMYTFRPLAAWHQFCQASTFYQVHSKTISGPDRGTFSSDDSPLSGMSATQRRMEQSLYWSCFKSECEMRVELPLPQSAIADFEYPHMFPSPPTPPISTAFPPNILNSQSFELEGISPGAVRVKTNRWSEELSWYYYLTEVALRRIGNRIMNTFYGKYHTSWLDVKPLITIAEEFEAQIATWSANLPIVMQYDSGLPNIGVSTSRELGWATANRLLEMKGWLYRPFLYYAIHTQDLRLDGPENLPLRRLIDAGMSCNESTVQNRSLRHRHHGLWFDIRALVTVVVVLSAVIKSGNISVPRDWEDVFNSVIETLRFWEDETQDLKNTRFVVEGLRQDSRRIMVSQVAVLG